MKSLKTYASKNIVRVADKDICNIHSNLCRTSKILLNNSKSITTLIT